MPYYRHAQPTDEAIDILKEVLSNFFTGNVNLLEAAKGKQPIFCRLFIVKPWQPDKAAICRE